MKRPPLIHYGNDPVLRWITVAAVAVLVSVMMVSCERRISAEKPAQRFVVEDIDSAHRYRVAYAITDTKTGRVYLMTDGDGFIKEVAP